MKKVFIIKPLEGMTWDNSFIALGTSKGDVVEIIGQPESKTEISFYYFGNELRFDFDENDNIKFIEFLGGIDGQIQPQIYGDSAFTADADEIVALLKKHNRGAAIDNENGYSYAFSDISVGLYRESIPENVQEMIEEAASSGETMSEEDIQYETRRAAHWATIGFGVRGYY